VSGKNRKFDNFIWKRKDKDYCWLK
jgi:hypothetical protein